ncbi:amino acid ABC transporter permease [Paraburkholderia fynbosensis]|uniref:Putative glutamine ABC transporter permease protein GlnM n=1 Tax=Paraburkholderia fynbosensis TaxID=1200993 RepID=A0A6J5H0N5_9BURK|nr:amino acid ABC transporter permease [Paraburkholderia fynbosensis]CAB3810443.1 putative glutamine ABC transporter permease protein GlnM [Paraburkholderia fynbosensis]
MHKFNLTYVTYLVLATRWTIVLSLIAFVGGSILGAVLAFFRVQERFRWLRVAASVFMRAFQVTPLLMQLFLAYFGLGVMGLTLDAWTAVSLAMICNAGAFLGDIWRGCIQAVPGEQSDAARALCLSYPQSMLFVVIPQATRIALAPTVGFLVQVVKSTSLASIVGFEELIRASQLVNTVTLRPILVYAVVMCIYFVLCWPLSLLSRYLDHRLRIDKSLSASGATKLLEPRLQDVGV